MNVRLLIDGIVRETTVLIAQLATSGGLRAPLSHVASQVFLDLSKELESQGVGKKVSADMFGLALRTYQRRTQRLAQSTTDRGRSLWEALFDYIERNGPVTREEIIRRFRKDDETSVRGVLRDLAESGIAFSAGTGASAVYRLASADELGKLRSDGEHLGLEALVWSIVFREGPLTLETLSSRSGLSTSKLDPIIRGLLGEGRIEELETPSGTRYGSRELVLGLEHPVGWEAAVLDHFAALARTIARKLRIEQKATRIDETGGSTYHLTVYRGHPFEDEALRELRLFRERLSRLRDRVDAYNAVHGFPSKRLRVDLYLGQSVFEESEQGDDQDF